MATDFDPRRSPDPLHRRDFFRQGLRNIFHSVARVVEDRLDRLKVPPGAFPEPEAGGGRAGGEDHSLAGRLLRPPGALKEDLFLDRCQRSGECIASCPVQAIKPLATEDGRLHGTPFIDPSLQACVVCEGLHCMRACPSGALSLVPRHLIAMGLAEVRRDLCVRTTGEECQLCVDRCPLGRNAIDIPQLGGPVEVKESGCVGCGVCEMACPTSPRAIVVRAR